MKYIIQIWAMLLFGWPAIAAGYIAFVINSGWRTGMFLADRHEDAAINKFAPKDPK